VEIAPEGNEEVLECAINRKSAVTGFLTGGGFSGAGRRAYCVWGRGEGWVFICLELQCDELSCT